MMAMGAAAGAWMAKPVPLWLAVAAALLAFVRRWPMLLWLAVALAGSGLAARSWSGLHPVTTGEWSGPVTLVSDPAPAPDGSGAITFIARVNGKRLQGWAWGRAADATRDRLAGDRLVVDGRVSRTPRLPAAVRRELAARHVAGRITVRSVGDWTPAGGAAGLANGVRRTLVRGAASMPAARRSLFTGFVLGDARGQAPDVVADFRASGLAHLLVVSGENVAFVLALAAPLLGRLPLAGRLVCGLAILGLFGVLTRWEPSVLRAEAMAAIALVAIVAGRPVSAIRLLALAVTGLLLTDPLLVGSTGFLLSVGATVGIALLARPLADALPGPRPIAAALAVTVAAQIGVAPAFLPAFGGLPVATVPANLLALPAAGPVMMWGLAAGIPAGLAGGRLAMLLHVPTSLAIGWVGRVASVAADLPLGQMRGPQLLALALAAVVLVVASRRGARRVAALALVVGLGAVAQPGL
ncbi:MAG: ComEC/Rec2-related protein, partial [Acidimicrobiales bacterium]|nr:ComEC/Rec2-related protein [Acidimicrobiales bacterium]